MKKEEQYRYEGKELMEIMTKKQLADLLSKTWKSNSKFKYWLFNNYKEVLREYENKEMGGMHIQFI